MLDTALARVRRVHVVNAPKKSGYGTSIITNLIPYELGGAAELAYPADGVRCRLDIPGKWLEHAH